MRLFVGVGLDKEMRGALWAAAEGARKLFPGRYADQDNYHITLQFIGQAEEAAVPGIKGAIAEAATGTEPFSIALDGLSYFRRPQDAVLFCGLKEAPPLERLALDVRQELKKAGVPLEEENFHPHITLARQARIDPYALAQVRVAAAFQQVREVTLFESRRVMERLRYMPLYVCPLEKSGT